MKAVKQKPSNLNSLQPKGQQPFFQKQGEQEDAFFTNEIGRNKPFFQPMPVQAIQRYDEDDTSGSSWLKMHIPPGEYVLEAANVKVLPTWHFENATELYFTASQSDPARANGLNASPHQIKTGNEDMRVKPGYDGDVPLFEPKKGFGAAKLQAFEQNMISSNDLILQTLIRFNTIPLVQNVGSTSMIGPGMPDFRPDRVQYFRVGQGGSVSRSNVKSLKVENGHTIGKTNAVTNSISSETSRNLGLNLGIVKIGVSSKVAISNLVTTSITDQTSQVIAETTQVSDTIKATTPGIYAAAPTAKVWVTPVTINDYNPDDGKFIGSKTILVYTLLYNDAYSHFNVAEDGKTILDHNLRPISGILNMTPDEFAADKAAQKELFEIAQQFRDKQQAFAEELLDGLKIKGKVKSILKRNTLDEFVKGIIQKCKRNSYSRIGEMDDMVRGRFDLRALKDVNAVAVFLKDQTKYPIKKINGVEAPRRPQEGGGFGYPRWHIIVQDPQTGLTHEWQVGTEAATTVYEKPGIKVPKEMESDVTNGLIKNDIHDIDYDIFRQGVKKKFPETHKELNIEEFHNDADKVSAEAGMKGEKTPDLESKITRLHKKAAIYLQKVIDKLGISEVRKFYH